MSAVKVPMPAFRERIWRLGRPADSCHVAEDQPPPAGEKLDEGQKFELGHWKSTGPIAWCIRNDKLWHLGSLKDCPVCLRKLDHSQSWPSEVDPKPMTLSEFIDMLKDLEIEGNAWTGKP